MRSKSAQHHHDNIALFRHINLACAVTTPNLTLLSLLLGVSPLSSLSSSFTFLPGGEVAAPRPQLPPSIPYNTLSLSAICSVAASYNPVSIRPLPFLLLPSKADRVCGLCGERGHWEVACPALDDIHKAYLLARAGEMSRDRFSIGVLGEGGASASVDKVRSLCFTSPLRLAVLTPPRFACRRTGLARFAGRPGLEGG